MDTTHIFGYVAGFCTTAAFLPQTIKTIRTGETKSLSLLMYIMFSVGVFLWIVYGLMMSALPIIIPNTITLCLSLIILCIIVRGGKKSGNKT